MKLDTKHIFEDKKANIKLLAESFEEANYGRTFWKYKFYINENLVYNKALNYDNDGLFTNLKKFIPSSQNNNYFFIPKYNPVIYNIKKDKFMEFKAPLKEGSSDFVKNYFHDNTLVIVYRSGLAIINLSENAIASVEYSPKEIYIEDATQINNKEIELDYRDLLAKCFKKKTIKI